MHSADSKMMFWSYPGDLTGHEVLWVAHVGIFKAHWAMLKDLEPQPKVETSVAETVLIPEIVSLLCSSLYL